MSFRFETHLNVPLKTKMRNLTWEQAAKYGVLHDLSSGKSNIASVTQEGDKVVILKRLNTKKNWLYRNGLAQKGWFERITIDRKEKSVAIDSFEQKWNIETGPYVWRRDLFFHRDDEPHRLLFVRHLFWVSQLKKFNEQFWLSFTAWRLKGKLKHY